MHEQTKDMAVIETKIGQTRVTFIRPTDKRCKPIIIKEVP